MTRKNTGAKTLGLAALSATITLGAALGAFAQSSGRAVSLESGSVIPVKLDNELSSNNTRKGDTFTASLRNDTDAEYYRLPTGTRVEGVVRDVRAKNGNDPGILDLDFRRLRLPDGHSYAIQGSLIGMDSKSVEKRSDGRLVAKPGHQNDRLTYSGYGAGAGLIVGLLTKHPLEDTALGGGLGYLFSSLQKGKSQVHDVDLKPGTELGVRLDSAVSLANYGSREDYDNYRNRSDDTTRFHRDNNAGADNSAGKGGGQYNRDDVTNRDDRNGRGSDGRNDVRGSGAPHDRLNASNLGVLIGDKNVTFLSTARPFMAKGVVMVPVRPVLDAAHIPFTFDSANQEIRATGDGGRVRLAVGSSIAVVNGSQRVRLDSPAQQLNGTTYVPMKFLSLVTGQEATYDAGSKTVIVNMGGGQADRDGNR